MTVKEMRKRVGFLSECLCELAMDYRTGRVDHQGYINRKNVIMVRIRELRKEIANAKSNVKL
jgi:hypothetical protein